MIRRLNLESRKSGDYLHFNEELFILVVWRGSFSSMSLLHLGQNQSSSGTASRGGSQQSIWAPIPHPVEPPSAPHISITSPLSCDPQTEQLIWSALKARSNQWQPLLTDLTNLQRISQPTNWYCRKTRLADIRRQVIRHNAWDLMPQELLSQSINPPRTCTNNGKIYTRIKKTGIRWWSC